MKKFRILLWAAMLASSALTACSFEYEQCWVCRGMGHFINENGEKIKCDVCDGRGQVRK